MARAAAEHDDGLIERRSRLAAVTCVPNHYRCYDESALVGPTN